MFSVTNDSYGKKNSPPSTVFSHIRTSHGVNSMYFNSMDQHNSEYVTSSPAHLFAGTRLPNTGTFHAVVNLPTSHRFSDFCYKEMLTNLFSFFQKEKIIIIYQLCDSKHRNLDEFPIFFLCCNFIGSFILLARRL